MYQNQSLDLGLLDHLVLGSHGHHVGVGVGVVQGGGVVVHRGHSVLHLVANIL